MPKLSAEQLAQRALDLDLITDPQLQEAWNECGSQSVEVDTLRQVLLRRELLTNYQIERLLDGQRAGFYYGDYKVHYLVGTGTFARVFRATHRKTNRQVAVKVLRKRYSDDPEQSDRFNQEGELCRSLRHLNIVPIYEVHSRGGVHYLVMEFVEGRNLREFMKVRKSFSPEDAMQMMVDIASGMDYAARCGVSHRDIKLSNVLVSSRGRAKLVDFGLAGADKNMSDEALANLANPRTIDYAGLERATGVRKDDARSDIFFVGCMYYHMLAGKPPLVETKDRIKRLSTARFRNIKPIIEVAPQLPLGIAMIVNKAIEFNPDRRYQTFAELLTDLKKAAKRLDKPDGGDGAAESEVKLTAGEGIDESGEPRCVMIVEADVKMQNVLRDCLKRQGYRVLVISDPKRAVDRFADDPSVAELVVFSTGAIGRGALDAFNQFGDNPATHELPAVLLLGENHKKLQQHAQLSGHRVAVNMPVKLRQFRETLVTLLLPEAK